jgi:Ca2+-binding RTX toxin-like protein
MRTGQQIGSWAFGQQLGGMDLSPDGRFLMIAEEAYIGAPNDRVALTSYRFDPATQSVQTYSTSGESFAGAFFDVAVLSDGRVLLGRRFGGSQILDLQTGQYSAGPYIDSYSILSPFDNGTKVLIADGNSSAGPLSIYETGSGVVANAFTQGYNWGVQAISSSTGFVAQWIYNLGINIYNPALQLVTTLTAWRNGSAEGLTFDATGENLFVLDDVTDSIVQVAVADWTVVRSIPVGFNVGRVSGQATTNLGNKLLLDPTGSYFSVLTQTGLVAVANPTAPMRVGSEGPDLISGFLFSDQISGGGGDDTIDGGGGDDSIDGGAGDDILLGGSGDDALSGAAGQDRLEGGDGVDALDGGAGDDIIDGGLGADVLNGGDGNDRFVFSAVQAGGSTAAAIGSIDGGSGYDIVDLSNVSPVTVGTLETSPGTYAFGFYVGSQRFTIGNVERILLGPQDNFISPPANAGPSVEIRAGDGADYFNGSGNYDVYGEGGDDSFFISGRFGESATNGLIDGGAGTNTLRTNINFTVDLAAGTAVAGQASYTVANIQNVVATTNGYASTIRGDGADNVFTVQASGDDGAAGVSFYGLGGNDRLSGSAGRDVLDGGSGNDVLDGRSGDDSMSGGPGDDIYIVDALGDTVTEFANEGTDEVRTALGSKTDFNAMYTLPANVENLTGTSATAQGVYGNTLNNVIAMGAGGDLVVVDWGGDDRVSGGGGNDFFYWGASFNNADQADGGAGIDTLGLLGIYTLAFDADDLFGIEKLAVYSSGDPAAPNGYTITMHDANLAAGQNMMVIAQSLSAGEVLSFNGAAELDGTFNVRGGKGADTITGGAGNDVIWGNLGADQMRGGNGNDMFDYNSVGESRTGAADLILDFTRGDRINLARIDADGNAANGDTSFTWLGDGAFTGAAGELRVSQHPQFGRTWVVEADVDGDKVADMTIYLVGPSDFLPQVADFVL